MRGKATILVIFLLLSLIPILSSQTSAIDLEGESSNVTVTTYVKIHENGLISFNFKVLWGPNEFRGSDIFQPQAYPPILQWSGLQWENLKENIASIDTIESLFSNPLPDGKNLTASPEYFAKTVLEIDTSFSIESVEPRIIKEFMTIEVKMGLMPTDSSYTISPLSFLSKIDFGGFSPSCGTRPAPSRSSSRATASDKSCHLPSKSRTAGPVGAFVFA